MKIQKPQGKRVETPADNVPEEVRPHLDLPPVHPVAQTLSQLELALARHQLSLVPAQAYVKQAIETTPRTRTDEKLELAVDELFRGQDTAAATKLVERTFADGGAAGIAQALAIFDAQAVAWHGSSPVETEALLTAVANRALELLAEHPPKTDHAAALDSIVAANEALACGQSVYATYSAIGSGVTSADAFSNEPGFPKLCDTLDVRGGAVVGVSGALMELGARGADLVLSVDANPHIPGLMLLYTGVLLAADAQAQAEGLSPDEQAARVLEMLSRGPHAETTEALRSIGYPESNLSDVDAQLGALKSALSGGSIRGWKLPDTLWCRGPNATEHVRHLTKLALEGRIVSVSADLADEEVVSRVNRVLELHDLPAKVFHFSNALDYIPNVKGTFDNFGRVRRTDDARITTTAYFVRSAGERQKRADLTGQLGTLDEPAALDAGAWFSGLGSELHDVLWSDASHRSGLVTGTFRRIGKPAPEVPSDYETFQKLVVQSMG